MCDLISGRRRRQGREGDNARRRRREACGVAEVSKRRGEERSAGRGSMGRGAAMTVLFVVCCLGALALTVEAGRKHENFAASTYYETTNETDSTDVVAQEEKSTVTPTERYPDGYPNAKHQYNPTTGMYEVNESNDTTVTPHERYPNGYPNAKHKYNPETGLYESNENTIVDRYAKGYPSAKHQWNSETQQYETVSESTVGIPEAGRYVKGYYNEAMTKADQSSTLPTVKSTGSQYTTVDSSSSTTPANTFYDRYPMGYHTSLPATSTFGPNGRYPYGYYPQTANTNSASTKTAQQYNGVSYTTTTQPSSNPAERYVHGYYADSEYVGRSNAAASSKAMPVVYSSSYTGNFNTLPYPSVGVPFVASGAGCRTAYWAANVGKWPSFFTAKSTVGDAFGAKATEVFGSTTILQALLKYGSDPYSELLRSGSTALLNSYNRGLYPIMHMKVIEEFGAALVSKEAATAQALVFETANVESISAGNACV